MPTLTDYSEFNGRHWETGSVCNVLAYRGVTAPHTGAPYSEALLLGISGGVVMGYFVFTYEGYDPMARILTRNTFDPLDTLLARLGVVQTVLQTNTAAKGVTNLVDTLDEGLPAIVWADMYSLPYNALPQDAGMWAMMPLVVYGYDAGADTVQIADRARVPLTITTAELAAARGRVKQHKQRILFIDPPNVAKLTTAVQQGIWDCIKLYLERPPKGARDNFGLAAYRAWATQLTKPTARRSWAKEFPPGPEMFAGLTSAFGDIELFGKDGHAERDLYADFLDEAAVLLERPALRNVAQQFRRSAVAWDELARCLLPDDVAPLREARELLWASHSAFLETGTAGLEQMRANNSRLEAIRAALETAFPLDEAGVTAVRERIAAQVMVVHDIEAEAVAALQDAMG